MDVFRAKFSEGVVAKWSDHVQAMLQSSDDPTELRDALMMMLQSSGERYQFAVSLIQEGWEKTMEKKQSSWTNMGVVGALILSVLYSAINQPFQKSAAVDHWTDLRTLGEKILIVCLYLSATFGLISVILSILLLVHLIYYVRDADDLVYFALLHRDSLVDVSLIACLLCCGISIPVSALVTNEEPVASITLFSTAVFLLLVLAFYVRSLFWLSKRERQKSAAPEKQAYLSLVTTEYQNLSKDQQGQDQDQSGQDLDQSRRDQEESSRV